MKYLNQIGAAFLLLGMFFVGSNIAVGNALMLVSGFCFALFFYNNKNFTQVGLQAILIIIEIKNIITNI